MATPIKRVYDRTEGSDSKELFYPETSAEAVMITDSNGDTVTLKTYLENLASNFNIQTPKDGTSGKGIDYIENEYGTFPREVLSLSDVIGYNNSVWSTTLLEVTDERPTVWRRYKIHYVEETSLGVYTKSEDADWTYVFCGTLGAVGKTGTSTEYVYKAYNSTDMAPTTTGATYSNDPESDYQQSGYVPSGWSNTPPNIKTGEVIYLSQRTYNGELWSDFTTPTVWGTTGQDAENVTFHIVYTQVKEGETPTSPPTTATITLPTYEGTVQNCGTWSETTTELVSGYVYWQSTGTFGEDGKLIKWTNPIRISGPTGRDGRSTECVYASTVDSDTLPDIEALWTSGNDAINSSYRGWYTTSVDCKLDGINTSALWMAQRVKNADGTWNGDLNNERYGWPEDPILISIYGKEGVDGDGIQFIYLRLSEEEYQLISKGFWNFDGGDSSDNPDNTPEGVTKNEPVTGSAGYLAKKTTVYPSVTYADGSTASGQMTITVPVNYTQTAMTYSGSASVTIGDYTYNNFQYKITVTACGNYKVIIANDIELIVTSEMLSDTVIKASWDSEQTAQAGTLSTVAISSDYSFKIYKGADADSAENVTSQWTGASIENSKFIMYKPDYTVDPSDTYWIQGNLVTETTE